MKNIKVSKYSNYRTNSGTEVYLLDWLKDNSFAKTVDNIRQLKNKADRDDLKSKLPCITPSGTFVERKVAGLIQHSGFICIDIDAKDNPTISDFSLLRDELKNILNIAYAGLSVSGLGVFCLIPIKYPEKHKEHFEALKICFEKVGIIIDKSCGDVSRLRGYSFDSDAYFNENAVLFERIFEYKNLKKTETKSKSYNKLRVIEGNSSNRILKIIKKINESQTDITETYDQWFQIACALANEFGEDGREMFHQISQVNPKYSIHSNDSLFNSCLENNYSFNIGTFFYWAEKYGFK